jgi:flagellar M-ring protein FliF
VPGVQSNVPPGTDQEPPQTSSSNSQTKNETVNYEISRTVSKIIEPVGVLKQLSVAVLVDGTYETAKTGDGQSTDTPVTVRKYTPRSEEDLRRIEDIVKKAMGFSADRQDQVQVVNVQFGAGPEESQSATAEAFSEGPRPWLPYLRYGVGILLFTVILLFVVRPLLTMLSSTTEPMSTEASISSLPSAVGTADASLAGAPDRTQIIDMARKNPDTTAVVVKQWLKNPT